MLLIFPSPVFAEEPLGVTRLLPLGLNDLRAQLPPGTQVLIEPAAIEQFLQSLDGTPPDWSALYGHGHQDPDHDERLFKLNRERDAARNGKEALWQRIAFLWSGELSDYDPESGGFHVALGPTLTMTRWGVVRFKYEDLPGNLVARLTEEQEAAVKETKRRGLTMAIRVVMVGTLVPEESIVYDFSHDEEGVGLIMPVVRVDHLLYLRSAP